MKISEDSTVLSSWKDIARYLGKGVRTVQRWERHLGLPVRRPVGTSQKSAVLLYRGDIDVWLATRFSARTPVTNEIGLNRPLCSARTTLRESIRTARELRSENRALRSANRALTKEITASILLLAERCDLSPAHGLQRPRVTDFARPADGIAPELTRVPEWLPSRAANRARPERIA